ARNRVEIHPHWAPERAIARTIGFMKSMNFLALFRIIMIYSAFPTSRKDARGARGRRNAMADDRTPVRRRRLGAHGLMFRRRRVFAQLREGFAYNEIAAQEGVSPSRIRQIVSQELRRRSVDSGAEHAKLQLDRLAPALQ